jgi:hypothetical protein
MEPYWNPAERLHPIDLNVLIRIPAGHPIEIGGTTFTVAVDVALKARRTTILENKDHPRVYVDENGSEFRGYFQWSYL